MSQTIQDLHRRMLEDIRTLPSSFLASVTNSYCTATAECHRAAILRFARGQIAAGAYLPTWQDALLAKNELKAES